MPQNKQMKIQWITVNGRQVPLVLPQVWNEDKQEWVVTSEYNPLPTADANVKAELESIKQTQQQILQRLNQPIDTRLTGSIVELASGFNEITISAGSTIYLLSSANLIEQGFTKVCVVIRTGGGQLTLQFVWRDLSSPGAILRRTNHSLTAGPNGNDVEVNVLSNHLNVAIVNSSNEDDGGIVRAMIFGVR